MTRSTCPTCRLRFSQQTAVHLAACPFCAQPLQMLAAADTLGFRLLSVDPLVTDEPAVAQSLALPPHGTDRPHR
jgi:hypothetical protein